MEEELDKQFPKGDKVRGKALVLFAIHKIKLADQKAKCHTEHIRTIRMIREWLKNTLKSIIEDEHEKDFVDILKEFDKHFGEQLKEAEIK